jgi:hypothetical protein
LPYAVASRRGCRQVLGATGKCGIQAILKLAVGSDAAAIDELGLPAPPRGRLKLWLGLHPRVRMPAAGAVTLPNFLRASPLNLVIRHLTSDCEPIRAETIAFEALDFDAY